MKQDSKVNISWDHISWASCVQRVQELIEPDLPKDADTHTHTHTNTHINTHVNTHSSSHREASVQVSRREHQLPVVRVTLLPRAGAAEASVGCARFGPGHLAVQRHLGAVGWVVGSRRP